MLSVKGYGRALAQICRYGGRGHFASDLLHSFVVADLVCDEYKLDALLHDATESQTGDIASNFKSPSMREAEHRLLNELYDHFGLSHITKKAHHAVKIADVRSRTGEIHTGIGDASLKKRYPLRDKEAERLHLEYFKKYPPADLLSPKSRAVKEFVRRFNSYRKLR